MRHISFSHSAASVEIIRYSVIKPTGISDYKAMFNTESNRCTELATLGFKQINVTSSSSRGYILQIVLPLTDGVHLVMTESIITTQLMKNIKKIGEYSKEKFFTKNQQQVVEVV